MGKKLFVCLSLFLNSVLFSQVTGYNHRVKKAMYSAEPNHLYMIEKSFKLAVMRGFGDTVGITTAEILDRLKAGVYNEDYENIPGIVGEHFPDPWNSGPVYDFNGLYGFAKIPLGDYTDSTSGWYRGLSHGYDPVQNWLWPGACAATPVWANSGSNSFTWDKAVELYKAGNKAGAYECIGHLLHLLEDLSVPAHVKLINHGISVIKINSGTIADPDLLNLTADEYETALSGGITLPNINILIPNLQNNFKEAVDSAARENIPSFSGWHDYFTNLATVTYNDKNVNKYYHEPEREGEWGYVKDDYGNKTDPVQYGITPLSKIGDRWAQIVLKSTGTIGRGSIIPTSAMLELSYTLVPKAVEFSAGLILYFYKSMSVSGNEKYCAAPSGFELFQNFPNPFNPVTTISYRLSSSGLVKLKVFDFLGKEAADLINGVQSEGKYEIKFDASNLSSGIYFYKIEVFPENRNKENFTKTKKLLLIK